MSSGYSSSGIFYFDDHYILVLEWLLDYCLQFHPENLIPETPHPYVLKILLQRRGMQMAEGY